MATKTIAWNTGGGNITVDYRGEGNGPITITTNNNALHSDRSLVIVVLTTDGLISKDLTVMQVAKPYINLSTAIVSADAQTYNGEALTPTVTVLLDGDKVPSTLYDVEYSNNTNAGTATITVTGKIDYTGTATGTFTINKANPVYTAPTATSLVYNGTGLNLLNAGSTAHGTIQYSSDDTSWGTDIPQGTNASEYTSYWKLIGDSNHNSISSTSITTTISKVTPTVVAPTPNTLTYNGSSLALVTAGNTDWGTLKYSLDNSTWSTSVPTAVNYGTYTVYYKVDGDSNINSVASVSILASIAEKRVTTPTITLDTTTYTYSGNQCTPTPTVKDGTTVIDPSEYTVSYSNNINAGTATVTISDNVGGNYYIVGSTTFTINKVTPTVTAPTAKTLTYNGNSQILANEGSTNWGTLQYSADNTTWSSTIPSGTNAGTNYKVYYRVIGDSNINDVASNYITCSIGKATPAYTAPTAKTLTYNGSALSLLNTGSTSHGTIQYSSDNSTWSTSIPTGTNATNYNTYWRLVGDSNHSDIGSTKIVVSISKVTPSITAPTAKSLTYTGSAQALINAGSVDFGTLQYSLNNSTWGTSIPTGTTATSYTVYYRVVGNSNINDVTSQSVACSIGKASLSASVSMNGWTYGGTASNPSVSGNSGGGSITYNYKVNGAADSTYTATKPSNAGTYVVRAQIAETTNYYGATVTNTFTIAKAAGSISYATTSVSKTYGDSTFTNTLTKSGDGSMTYASSDTSVATVNSSGQVTIVKAGSCTITATVSDGTNYTYATKTASYSLSVAKANPVYVAPTANNRTYDTSSAALLVAGSNTTSGSFTYSTSQSGTYSTTIPSQTNAGTYTTWWKFTPTDTTNYNSIGATSVSTTISAKTVSSPTITLSQSTYTYSGSACTPTATVKDGSTTISSSEYTVSYSNNTNAGTATVTITDKSGGNYTVSGSTTFTINKANPTYTAPTAITGLTYSGSSQYLVTAGSTSHGTIQYSSNGTTWSTTRPSSTNAGSYTTYWRLVGDSNHNDVASTSLSTTIAKASRTLSFADSYVVLDTSSNVTKTATPSAGSGDGAITYSISSTTYATINSSSGKVTSKTSDGSAIVTATIAEGTNYLSATASYNLYVFATTHNYSYNGSYRSVTLPPGTYQFQCWGAQGGSNGTNSSYGITAKAGGKGGYSVGQLTVSQATGVRVYVGGAGSSSAGGYNGGGSTVATSQYSSSGEFGYSKAGGGGGATDIRLSDGALLSRMIVAGGGSGGAMCYKEVTETVETWEELSTTLDKQVVWQGLYQKQYSVSGVSAGDDLKFVFNSTNDTETWVNCGGGTVLDYSAPTSGTYYYNSARSYGVTVFFTDSRSQSYSASFSVYKKVTSTVTTSDTYSQVGYVGGGTNGGGQRYGTQNSAGAGGGDFGEGANQWADNYRYVSGAGGGGWYGGGRRWSDSNTSAVSDSGGGSGWVNTSASAGNRPSGYTGLQLDSGETKAGNTSFPSTSGGNETGHAGNGYARITRL